MLKDAARRGLNTLNHNVRAIHDGYFFAALIEAIYLEAFSRLFVAGIAVIAYGQDVEWESG